jgi:hypothetical protein
LKVREILDWLCALDPRYGWSRYKSTINIVPKAVIASGDQDLLNKKLGPISFEAVSDPSRAVFQAVSQLPGPREQIAYLQAGGPATLAKPWHARFANLTVREAFDEISQALGKNYGWTLSGAKNFRVIRFHAQLTVDPRPD